MIPCGRENRLGVFAIVPAVQKLEKTGHTKGERNGREKNGDVTNVKREKLNS